MKTVKKTVLACLTFIVLVLSGKTMVLQAQTIDPANVPVINNVTELNTVSAAYTKEVTLADEEEITYYFSFSLAEDSWVIFRGNYSLMNHDGCQTHVSVYSDSSFSNMKFEYGWGY